MSSKTNEDCTTDAISFGIFKKKSEKIPDGKDGRPIAFQTEAVGPSPTSDYYDMGHYKRGKAIIFNHQSYDDYSLPTRTGTEVDAKNIKSVLEDLKFDVHRYDDLKYGKIYDVLADTAAEDHTDSDCLVVVVMSHGDTGIIHARDHHYPTDTLWTPFTGDSCPSLAGKPKLFFIQACRGDEIDDGVQIKHDANKMSSYTIPSMADFLIMYSTSANHYSFRSPTSGSWLIQALCAELRLRARHQDLMTILTFVNRKIAIEFESNVPKDSKFHQKKQYNKHCCD